MAKKEAEAAAPVQVPTVGRVVHYVDRNAKLDAERDGKPVQPYAAIVARVTDEGMTLAVLNPELGCIQFRNVSLEAGEPGEANQWGWPPRV